CDSGDSSGTHVLF
nr:immunoglobulin light chain junction region [Macaca mulatta]